MISARTLKDCAITIGNEAHALHHLWRWPHFYNHTSRSIADKAKA